MTSTPAAHAPAALPAVPFAADDIVSPCLDAERLDVYRCAVEFQALAATLGPAGSRVLRDQLERASVSIVLCVAEGGGRRSRRDKAHFYTMARGSAAECGAILDLVAIRGLAPVVECRRGKALLVRIISMLTRLQQVLA